MPMMLPMLLPLVATLHPTAGPPTPAWPDHQPRHGRTTNPGMAGPPTTKGYRLNARLSELRVAGVIAVDGTAVRVSPSLDGGLV